MFQNRPAQTLPEKYLLHNQYYIGKVLGSGGYGITYLAWDEKQNRRFAIKELYPRHIASRPDGIRVVVSNENKKEYDHIKVRFCEEAKILYELRAIPEVLQVYHLFEENGTAYYVMEYLEGMDMKRYLQSHGTMKWSELMYPVAMILRALQALHSKSLIHRDISPDNIFITKGMQARLIDFGSARSYSGNKMLTTMLKASFAPYEQYREDGKQGPYSDIYSLSVSMYYALSGQLPPNSMERFLSMKMGKGAYADVESLEILCPGLPEHVSRTVMKGMATLPEDRWQTIEEFSANLFPGQAILRTKQVKPIQNNAARSAARLQCVQGYMKGKIFTVQSGQNFTVGRETSCTIVYPPNMPGVSRVQCSMRVEQNRILYIRDENSSYGVSINGNRLVPLRWYPLKSKDRISFAKEEYFVL